ncbi:hypothetical protein [Tranquillimonas alkanivorans]|uniref:Uncharacterized protein n=1 Tax=Tranquillimonas alkanivorans TaxID=441119 RepID=A0A1I5N5J3_9RHOB|nr:hypothetical protein [Tranquillimonas alkanivorans]SFP17078.1 hypothetical protein SAMN04488047_103109 [Tranquillimonas alkanivorans]
MTRAALLWTTGAGAVALAALVLWAVPFDWSEVRVQQATIAAVVVAAGWFMGFLLREIGQQLSRSERLRDAHRALYAEIQHNLGNLGTAEELQGFGQEMLGRIRDADGFVPFIPRERNDTVFRALVSEIHILPRTSIDPVVQYYSQLAALDALVDDMRGDSFKTMSPLRRADIYTDYIGIKLRLIEYGNEALATIDAYAKGGRRKARRVSEKRRAARREAQA